MELEMALKTEATFGKRCKEFGYNNFITDYRHHIIPGRINEESIREFTWHGLTPFYDVDKEERYNAGFSSYYFRSITISYAGFSLIDKEVAKALAKHIGNRKCLDIMSGLAAYPYALKQQGADIIASDLKLENNATFKLGKEWMEVEEIDCREGIKKYHPDVLICNWPRADSPITEATKILFDINSKAELIYIGEGYDGCCASNDYWDFVNFNYVVDIIHEVRIPQWEGIHDFAYSIRCK